MPGEQGYPQTTPNILQAVDVTVDYMADKRGTAPAPAAHPGNAYAPPTVPIHTLALSHVNLAINQGQSIAIMGPSGSGKSTLLHALAGIITPTSGQVLFRGRSLGTYSDARRSALRRTTFGFVFQSGQLLPELNAVENVALPLMLAGQDYRAATEQAATWLDRVGIRPLAAQRPGEMSGGQMQRVAIARALCINPSVIFADEPTGALDQNTGHEVMALLMEVASHNGSAVIVVTHDPSVAGFCGSVITMQDGQLITDSAANPSLVQHPANQPYQRPPVQPASTQRVQGWSALTAPTQVASVVRDTVQPATVYTVPSNTTPTSQYAIVQHDSMQRGGSQTQHLGEVR